MLTSSSETEKVKEAIGVGINDYILEPFNPERLTRHIVETLQKASNTWLFFNS